MGMRKLSAHFIFTGTGQVLEKGIVTVDKDGTILEITDTKGNLEEKANVEFFSGVLVPGFVNAHCHLELSHLHGTFPEKAGLPEFLKNVVIQRREEREIVLKAARKADLLMWKNGIVAVGDISNGADSFRVKTDSKILYHTFIEALGFSPTRAERAFDWAEFCLEEARLLGLSASIVPHSPYSISSDLFKLIAAKTETDNSILSIHNQESLAEDELYISREGEIVRHLEENLGIDVSGFAPTGKGALASILDYLPKKNNLLLVHNIYTTQQDIDLINSLREPGCTWLALCPGSNLFIENRLPDIPLFRRNELPICIGTDSLSSNLQLSVLEEIKHIQLFYPEIPFGELIVWATKNGAEALRLGQQLGTIEPGKRPGINLISGMNLKLLKLKPSSKVKRLI
jgi:cytosine/adenosine deaminase-related metal-dependent hydrolase